MKLRNKKTGEVFDALIRERGGGGSYSLIVCDIKNYQHSKNTLDETHFILDEYDSLAELNEKWEDAFSEKPKTIWWLDNEGFVNQSNRIDEDYFEKNKEIGNYFLSREEAEKAVEKLKAWKRLKDKGFRFTGYTDDSGDLFSCQVIRCRFDDFGKESRKDLDLIFGGEK